MYIVRRKNLSSYAKSVIVFIAVLLSYNIVFAFDESRLLEALVNKGIMEKAEALEIKKSTAEIPVLESAPESIVKISAKMQTQFQYMNTNGVAGDLSEVSHTKFMLRRMILTFNSDTRRDWGTQLSFDFILPHCMSITYIWKRVDTEFIKGEARFGYIKSDFAFEENMSPFKLYCVERSIATYYWGGPKNVRRLGFASFHTGAYWFGQSRTIEGLKYSMSVSNSQNYEITAIKANNTPNLYFAVNYNFNIADAKLRLGLNTGWGADADNYNRSSTSGIWGLNPYITLDYGELRSMAEFMVSGVDSGKDIYGKYSSQLPMGMNFMIERRFEFGDFGKIAPAFRFTFLETDGRGVLPSDGLRHCLNISGDGYERARGFYIGLNWYIKGDNLKVQTGYEYSQFFGGKIHSRELEVNSFRTQLQVLF